MWLLDDLKSAIVANGLPYDFYPEGPRDPSLTIVRGKETLQVLRARLDRALWRELHSIAAYGRTDRGGPLTLRHMRWPGSKCALWTGAVLTKSDMDAKVQDTVESIFLLPAEFLTEVGELDDGDPKRLTKPNAIYQQGVALAEKWAARLQGAIRAYRRKLADKDKGGAISSQATMRYWTALEQKAEEVLLHAVAVRQEGFDPDEEHWIEKKSPWGKEVMRAARDAYDFACPHATPRQLQAYAEGLKVLFGEEKRAREKAAADTEE